MGKGRSVKGERKMEKERLEGQKENRMEKKEKNGKSSENKYIWGGTWQADKVLIKLKDVIWNHIK